MQVSTDGRMWSPVETAEFLGASLATIYQWVETGFLPHYKVGRLVRFDPTELARWLDGRRKAGDR